MLVLSTELELLLCIFVSTNKRNCNGSFSDRKQYLVPINQAFDEKFENEQWLPEALELAEKKDKEDFEDMKNKMKKMVLGTVIGVILAVVGAVAYKYFKG